MGKGDGVVVVTIIKTMVDKNIVVIMDNVVVMGLNYFGPHDGKINVYQQQKKTTI